MRRKAPSAIAIVLAPHARPDCPDLRGVAARARSIRLISSMDRKPSRKGGARPRPKQHHPVPQGPPFSIKCRLATGCPPEAHNQSQLKHSFSRPKHTNTARPFCHTAHTRAHLISCVGGVITRHRNHIRFKRSSAAVQPYGPLNHTGVQCRIN